MAFALPLLYRHQVRKGVLLILLHFIFQQWRIPVLACSRKVILHSRRQAHKAELLLKQSSYKIFFWKMPVLTLFLLAPVIQSFCFCTQIHIKSTYNQCLLKKHPSFSSHRNFDSSCVFWPRNLDTPRPGWHSVERPANYQQNPSRVF